MELLLITLSLSVGLHLQRSIDLTVQHHQCPSHPPFPSHPLFHLPWLVTQRKLYIINPFLYHLLIIK